MNGDLEICPGPAHVVAVLSNMDPPLAMFRPSSQIGYQNPDLNPDEGVWALAKRALANSCSRGASRGGTRPSLGRAER